MKLGMLDQSPIPAGQTAREALVASARLAQLGEELGYTRYWIAEHHDLQGLASSVPEVMLGYIGAQTKSIRIGSGAVLLPHYRPYKVAETYNLLATLFPGRIDIGIGRAPGGSAEATTALSGRFLEEVWKLPDSIRELLHFLHGDFPEDHLYAKVKAAPVPDIPPEPWLLGTSGKSAKLAAELGISYAFGQFMSDKNGADLLRMYHESFQGGRGARPQSLLTVSVICAETAERAEEIAASSLLWRVLQAKGEGSGVPSIEEAKLYPYSPEEQSMVQQMKESMLIGDPQTVKKQLLSLREASGADEMMMVTITHDFADRLQSYRLLARELL
ncbi:LLM class flavin-dependent oxidoreductase [Ectobacillus ponti]|uniref:LLM class flavin-dependent oxidoreductase n=1 Tax=Ectobacillus ponti TaxID=2961894 RepID=A0AA41XCG9_9BACI|nr:LLM class flavin-dependent oxidoreductase [Ectobacillus ponti]MCP8970380.1 LLM class flavin-dependent oxidoreductase [Ectobacillus ponti]